MMKNIICVGVGILVVGTLSSCMKENKITEYDKENVFNAINVEEKNISNSIEKEDNPVHSDVIIESQSDSKKISLLDAKCLNIMGTDFWKLEEEKLLYSFSEDKSNPNFYGSYDLNSDGIDEEFVLNNEKKLWQFNKSTSSCNNFYNSIKVVDLDKTDVHKELCLFTNGINDNEPSYLIISNQNGYFRMAYPDGKEIYTDYNGKFFAINEKSILSGKYFYPSISDGYYEMTPKGIDYIEFDLSKIDLENTIFQIADCELCFYETKDNILNTSVEKFECSKIDKLKSTKFKILKFPAIDKWKKSRSEIYVRLEDGREGWLFPDIENDEIVVAEELTGEEYAVSGGYLVYEESDGDIIITGCYGEYTDNEDRGKTPYLNDTVVIPNRINGKYVKEVKGDSFSKYGIENLIILGRNVKIQEETFPKDKIFYGYNFTKDSLEDVDVDRIIIENSAEKLGFIDKTGKVVIPCVYEYAMDFSEELACVKQYGIYGYINKMGEVEIPFDYVYANPFFEGVAVVSDEWGKLKVLYKNKEEYAFSGDYLPIGTTRFENGFARVINPATAKKGLVNKKGEEVVPCIYDEIEISDEIKGKKDGEYVVLNIEGK